MYQNGRSSNMKLNKLELFLFLKSIFLSIWMKIFRCENPMCFSYFLRKIGLKEKILLKVIEFTLDVTYYQVMCIWTSKFVSFEHEKENKMTLQKWTNYFPTHCISLPTIFFSIEESASVFQLNNDAICANRTMMSEREYTIRSNFEYHR